MRASTVSRLVPVEGEFLPGVYALPLPGHTDSLHGIAFQHKGKRILVAGDAVMTKYHYEDNKTEFQPGSEDEGNSGTDHNEFKGELRFSDSRP